ncbi:MAG: phenylacetate-CoA oxygenase subunit PaaC [Rhodobacteraceae bacterium]|nr:phenylacetate-CoA oxygenase subunit PaaC [Paracoccaceae bacterium]
MFEFLLRMGDNTLVLGHRVSEWCGHAPVLEEDIALANIALDMIGQTRLWLGLAGEVEGQGRDADALAFRRDAWDFRNLLLVERPNRDFGHTLMRQFLFDLWHHERLSDLCLSEDDRVAGIAAKCVKEADYHLERSKDLIIRLGDGSAESHRKMQDALDALWPYVGEMFSDDTLDIEMNEAGIAPLPSSQRPRFDKALSATLALATLIRPESNFAQMGGRSGTHTEDLGHMLATMQFLQRAYPDARW